MEPYGVSPSHAECIPGERPGTRAFADWVIDRYGGGDIGIERPCEWGTPSHHHAGRAWDWGVNANDPADVARVQALFAELFANDDALIRRAGIVYIIWDRQIWSTKTLSWSPYTGASPHTDHVHFSFSVAGADGLTSFYADKPLPPDKPAPPAPPPHDKPAVAARQRSYGAAAAGAAVAAAATIAALRRLSNT